MSVDHSIADGLYSPLEDVSSSSKLEPLCETEIVEFFRDIDRDGDGTITLNELATKLEEIYENLDVECESPTSGPTESGTMLTRGATIRRGLNQLRRRAAFSPYSPLESLERGPKRSAERQGLRTFMAAMIPSFDTVLTKNDFMEQVKTWNIPSQAHNNTEPIGLSHGSGKHKVTWYRMLRARWSVQGPSMIFVIMCTSLIVGMASWQGILFYQNTTARNTLSNAVIVTRLAAGALWPTMSLLLFSMSRWLATLFRRFPGVSAFMNWDRSESFHIKMSILALSFATVHSIGHMGGTLVSASQSEHQKGADQIFRLGDQPVNYAHLVSLLPGWTGIVSLALFWMIAILSLPVIRKRCYEAFQLGHLLMFPFFVLISVHGALKLVMYPMMGMWIAVPCTLIAVERILRLFRGFRRLRALIKMLDKATIQMTVKHPKGSDWPYRAGQYVLVQVPELSFWQWHPITISSCRKDSLQLIIAINGDWTRKLGQLAKLKPHMISVGLDGPFGAPAQRFYSFDRSIIIGSGVGVTPFSAILADMESNLKDEKDPWVESEYRPRLKHMSSYDRSIGSITPKLGSPGFLQGHHHHTRSISTEDIPRGISLSRPDHTRQLSIDTQLSSPSFLDRDQPRLSFLGHLRRASRPVSFSNASISSPLLRVPIFHFHTEENDIVPSRRRVDFHWIVSERKAIRWLSSLLNRVHDLAAGLNHEELELNIATHITAKQRNISEHIFRYLLDSYRTESAPVSALTGLKARSSFGRPDLVKILNDYYRDEVARMKLEGTWGRGQKVGVFFCGNPSIGHVLADTCAELTAMGRADGSKVRFVFMTEVFA